MDVEFEQRSTSGCELVTEVARRFGEVRLRVTGASMLPAVWPGDILCVRQCTIPHLQPGEIILYRRDGKLVAHRITRTDDTSVTTKGDSVECDDAPIRESEVVGRVVSVIRRGRRVPDRLSGIRRIGSWILRRSDFCVRVAVLLARYDHQSGKEEIPWA